VPGQGSRRLNGQRAPALSHSPSVVRHGQASGTIALWAGAARYDIPFRNAVATDTRERTAGGTPIIVRFPLPVVLDGAAVASLIENGTEQRCDPLFAPWFPGQPAGPERRTAAERRAADEFLERAAAISGIEAPDPITDPRPCTTPDRTARTVVATQPEAPPYGASGFVDVLVVLDATDRVTNVRVDRSRATQSMERAALAAASTSQFTGATFRCHPIVGAYRFSVEFGP
jgi:TonB family protein